MLISLALLAAAPVAEPVQQRDLRCIAVLSASLASMSEAERGKLVPGVLYYVGRVEGREPGIDLQSAIVRAVGDEKTFTAMFEAEGKRCGEELRTVGLKLQQVGAALQREGSQP